MKEVIKKFKFKDTCLVINAPLNLENEFKKLGCKTSFDKNVKCSNTLFFINNSKEFVDVLKNKLKFIEDDSVLWFAYPKGTSKIKTDINRDILRVAGEEFGITTVAAISINEIWSGLRFRPISKVGTK